LCRGFSSSKDGFNSVPLQKTKQEILFSSFEKNDGDTHTCKVMFIFILGEKYFEIKTSQEEYSSGFITIMNKFHTVVSQQSERNLQFADSMFTREIPRIK
jgi:hypothetical protein